MKQLLTQALVKFFCGVVLVGALLFWPAGTFDFWNGWLLMGILFVPMFAAGLVMLFRCPGLLRRRLNGKEQEKGQQLVIRLSGLMFLVSFAAAGFCRRFHRGQLPGWVSLAAAAVFLAAYLLYAEVLRENVFLSRTIEVQQNQTVVDTGLYGIVRHPMYSVTLLLFLSMPLVLGSWVSLLPMLVYPAILVGRIRQEEQLLERELAGYRAYEQKVRWRLLPGVW